MKIRSVLDARSTASPHFLGQALLLAHSWAAWGGAPPLEVFVLGTVPSSVHARLRELGVEVTTSRPHPLDPVSKSANKFVALREPSDTAVLLVDNDVCFLDDVSDLHGRNVLASVASGARVSDEQWAHIAVTTGLRPLAVKWVPLNREVRARQTGRRPKANGSLYLNAGIVWVSQPVVFESIWAASVEAIARAFDGSPLSTYTVRGSDQAGFATAVAAHGSFDLLPPVYNYRPVCFRLDVVDQPKILHLTKFGAKEPLPFSNRLPFSKTLTAFWDRRIIQPIEYGSEGVRARWRADAERERLLDEAVSVRDRLLGLATEAGLDAFTFCAGRT